MAYIPIDMFKTEIEIKKSRFIGLGYPIDSTVEAREILKDIRKEYPDSRHVCYAFVFGKKSTHMGMSDDGEPNGTAGRPMLEVVKGSGYENILVAAVRYFGGIKLGTGGLVKAYTEITQEVVAGIEVEEFVEKSSLKINIPYNIYESIKKNITEYQGSIKKEEFLGDVYIEIEIPTSEVAKLKDRTRDLTKGELNFSNL